MNGSGKKNLKRREELLRYLLDAVKDVVWAATPNGSEYLYINESTAVIYGRPLAEFNENHDLWMAVVHPEDHQRAIESARLIFENNQTETEYRIIQPDGQVRWLNDRKYLIRDEDGDCIGIGGIAEDITRRRMAEHSLQASERRYRLLVENSLSAVMIIQEHRIAYCNAEHDRLLGLLPDDPAQYRHFRNIHPDDREEVRKVYDSMISGETSVADMQIRVYPYARIGSEKEMKYLHFRGTKIEYDGKPAVFINFMDTTQAKLLEQKLRSQDKMASLGRISAGIAHEIRNPLGGINMYARALEEQFNDPGRIEDSDWKDIRNCLEKIQTASDKIESVIRRVLDFSKTANARMLPTDINRLVEETISLAAVTLRTNNVHLEKKMKADLPKCPTDAAMFEQALLNIINNAVVAMRETNRPRQIEIRSDYVDGFVLVGISDSGPGVPPELRRTIFEPFMSTRKDGVGIGLSISRRIAVDHGGGIELTESKWGGAEFIIKLPVEKGMAAK